jgi:hypothetical protein
VAKGGRITLAVLLLGAKPTLRAEDVNLHGVAARTSEDQTTSDKLVTDLMTALLKFTAITQAAISSAISLQRTWNGASSSSVSS